MELSGILAISKYTGLSEATLMDLRVKEDFPMENKDSIWVTSTENVEAWKTGSPLSVKTTAKKSEGATRAKGPGGK